MSEHAHVDDVSLPPETYGSRQASNAGAYDGDSERRGVLVHPMVSFS